MPKTIQHNKNVRPDASLVIIGQEMTEDVFIEDLELEDQKTLLPYIEAGVNVECCARARCSSLPLIGLTEWIFNTTRIPQIMFQNCCSLRIYSLNVEIIIVTDEDDEPTLTYQQTSVSISDLGQPTLALSTLPIDFKNNSHRKINDFSSSTDSVSLNNFDHHHHQDPESIQLPQPQLFSKSGSSLLAYLIDPSVDGVPYDEAINPLNFQERLTSEMAHFQLCEYLLMELEAVHFSSLLPPVCRQIEQTLLDAEALFDSSSPCLRSTSTRKRLHCNHTRVASVSSVFESVNCLPVLNPVKRFYSMDNIQLVSSASFSYDSNQSSPISGSFSHQAALSGMGLVRYMARRLGAPAKDSLRFRCLQQTVASISDQDWVNSAITFYPNGATHFEDSMNNLYMGSSDNLNNKSTPLFPLSRSGGSWNSLRANHSTSNLIQYSSPALEGHDCSLPPIISPTSNSNANGKGGSVQLAVGVENFFRSVAMRTPTSTAPLQSFFRTKHLIALPPLDKSKRQSVLRLQRNQCAGCGIYVETKYLRNFRFCEYFGRFFCCVCHNNTLMVLPGAVVCSWNFSMLPVSNYARDHLTLMHTRPLLHLSDFAPNVIKQEAGLRDVIQLRQQASAMLPFLQLCQDGGECVMKLKQLPDHWTISTDSWSLADLCSIFRGKSMATLLRTALEMCVGHLNACLRCKARGFICGVCHTGGVLFPHFGQVNTMVCVGCGACYHRPCLPRPSPDNCPRCLRRCQKQQNTIHSSPNSERRLSDSLQLIAPSL